jgi:flagellar motor protein MotB
MSEGEKGSEKPKSGDSAKAPESPWTGLWKSAADKLGPLLVSLVVSVGFVAFAGKAVLWVRFDALGVPPDQVVKAVPEGEAVAVGASMLLLFGLVGLLAAISIYLVDRGGRATPGMSRSLLVVFAVEALVAIWLTAGKSIESQAIASEAVLLALGTIFWSTFVCGLVKREGVSVPGLRGDRVREEEKVRAFYQEPKEADPTSGITTTGAIVAPAIAMAVGAFAFVVVLLFSSVEVATIAGLAGLAFGLVGAIVFHLKRFDRRGRARLTEEREQAVQSWKDREEDRRRKRAKKERKKAKKRLRREADLRGELALRSGSRCCEPPPEETGRLLPEEAKLASDGEIRPPGVEFVRRGLVLTVVLALVVIVFPPLILHEWWLAVSLGSIAVLGAGLWRISGFGVERFTWYGLAVFISVPLFGTLTLMARNADEPQVQPVAMIRNTDGPDEAIQGLYVTETAERVYFANVATEGCENKLTPDSGRLLWVPEKEVVAMSIGPLQSVRDAGQDALEMSYALTPAVETPAGDNGGLTTSEQRAQRAEELAVPSKVDQRLENAGPAVRPNFGSGLAMIPETASPGDEVTLRMSIPNEKNGVDGFGETPEGRALRLNGIRLSVLRETAPTAEEGEYVRTVGTKTLLTIEKRTLYRERDDGGFVRLGPNSGFDGHRFVKLEDDRVTSVHGGGAENTGRFLEVDSAGQLVETPEVTLEEGGEWVPLEKRLLRQAWSPTEIKFRVPDNAATGVVTVECDQLAGQPLLRVTHAPTARIAVQMSPGSDAVVLDSSRSSDEDESKSEAGDEGEATVEGEEEGKPKSPGVGLKRRWTIEGVPGGHDATTMAQLPPRLHAYSVELTVTDESGNADTATLRLLRLPSSLFAFDHGRPKHPEEVATARAAIKRAVAVEKPIEIELDGHSDNPGTYVYNLNLSLERDDHIRKVLLSEEKQPEASGPTLPVKELAYGESCQLDKRAGRRPRNRRVDVFILSEGVTVKPPDGCHPGRLKSLRWHLPPPKEAEGP